MRVTFNFRDLKITEDECWQILDENNETTEEFELELSRDGNYRVMAVGYTKEVGMKATKTYQHLYSEKKRP